MDFRYAILQLLVVTTCVQTALSNSSCTEEARSSNLSACLEAINEAMFDTDRFWFGSQYAIDCPLGPAQGLQCANSMPNQPTSILTRLFDDLSYVPRLDRFLEMEFESIERNYTGCGATYRTDGTEIVRINVDPLSLKAWEAWYYRHRPALTWDASPSDFFTLIVYDAGTAVLHGLYMNIPGNNITAADAIKPYHGPLITTEKHNVYVFLLYKYDVRINVTSEITDTINRPWGYTGNILTDFLDKANIGVPVAVNWILATGDTYAAGVMASTSVIYMCPIFTSKALRTRQRPFIPDNTMLTVGLDVTFSTENLAFTVCCSAHSFTGKNTLLNPIQNPVISTVDTRSEARIMYKIQKIGPVYGSYDFSGEMHMLVVLDPDVPSPNVGTEAEPLIHGMTINIQNGNFSTGEVVHPYMGPSPPDNRPHYYYFLLYKQVGMLNATDMTSYAGVCPTRLSGRCRYNISQSVDDFNLTLVGASWFQATTDDYVIKRRVDNDPSLENSVCAGKPGYADPCPISGVSQNRLSSMFSLLNIFIATIVFLNRYSTEVPQV